MHTCVYMCAPIFMNNLTCEEVDDDFACKKSVDDHVYYYCRRVLQLYAYMYVCMYICM